MTDRSIFVAMLAYDGKLDVQCHLALANSYREFDQRGWSYDCLIITGNSAVHIARNTLVGAFLELKATDFVMVDNDVTWPAGVLPRMIDHPVDFVAGVYPTKQEPEQYRFIHQSSRLKSDPETGLLEVHHVPLGFVRLRRSVLERMVSVVEDDWFDLENTAKRAWPLFEFEQHGHQSWGEDFVFCRKWRALGEKVWVDPSIYLGHCGSKVYIGNFGHWLSGLQRSQEAKAADDSKAFMP